MAPSRLARNAQCWRLRSCQNSVNFWLCPLQPGFLSMRHLCLLATLFVLPACSSDPQPSPPVPPLAPATAASPESPSQTASPPPTLHAIHNDHLQQLMIQMNALVYGEMRDELDAARQKREQIKALATTAGQLSSTVKAIIKTLPSLDLNPDEQASFMALANNLRTYARQMETQARKNDIQAIPATLDQLTLTCGACHSLFRKNHGLLERCRDPQHTC